MIGNPRHFESGWDEGTTAFPADAWLTGLQVLAVQPACLRAHPGPFMTHEQDVHGVSAASDEQHEHRLLLQLMIVLSSGPTPRLAQTDFIGFSPLPLLVHRAVLELTVVSKQAMLAQQQYGLLQLLPHEQLQLQQPAQFTVGVDNTDPSAGSSQSWTIPLQLTYTCPVQPSTQPLDYLDLLLTIRTAEQEPQQLHEQHSSTMSDCIEGTLNQPSVGLVAAVPLLVLPALAQQEVQQLLLPAMRQEVQAEQQQQEQEHAQEERQQEQVPGQETSAPTRDTHSLQIVSTVWQHYQQLVNDIYTVMLLVDMMKQPEAEAAASSIAAEAVAAATAAQHPSVPPTVVGTVPAGLLGHAQASSSAAAAVPNGLSSEAALVSLGHNLLFPVLLPFLAAHGLHNLLQLLVACLPAPLQQQWEQQQQESLRLADEATAAAAQTTEDEDLLCPEAGQVSVGLTAAEPSACSGADEAEVSATAAPGPQVADLKPGTAEQEQLLKLEFTKKQHEGSQGPISSPSGRQGQLLQQQQQQEEEEKENLKGGIKTGVAASADTAAAAARGPWPAAAGGVGPVFWYSPLVTFEHDVEARYLTWKHYTLIHLDYIGALFAVMYLLALLRRMLTEPTTLFYFVYVLLKCMPLAPLILGFRHTFLRYRELWLWLVIPTSLLTFMWFTAVQKIATPTTLLPQKAISAYWNGHGELMTSAMRPFIQHMRLRPYLAYTVADAAMVVWVFAQFYGWWAAVGRWGFAAALSIGLCWGLDLHMRRRFVALQR